jgi:hypothetical protein
MEAYSFSELAGIQALMGILAIYEDEHQVKTWISNYFEKSLDKPVGEARLFLHLRDEVKLQAVALRMAPETRDHSRRNTMISRELETREVGEEEGEG